jgi:hypothetical protein
MNTYINLLIHPRVVCLLIEAPWTGVIGKHMTLIKGQDEGGSLPVFIPLAVPSWSVGYIKQFDLANRIHPKWWDVTSEIRL